MAKTHEGSLLPSRRLALMGVLGVVVVMFLALLAFNVFERRQLEQEAIVSVDDALGWQSESSAPATRAATILYLDQNMHLIEYDSSLYSVLDQLIADWCSSNPQLDTVQKVEFGNNTCYVELSQNDGPRDSWMLNTEYLACYVDVTPQLKLVSSITFIFVGIALVGAACAGAAGWFAGKRIEQAQDTQKRFYENMSHELKTPLAAIRGYADGILAGVMEPSRSARAITHETDRMTQLVEQILSMSRLEAGTVRIHPEPIGIDDLVQDTLMPFEGIAQTRGINVELDVTDQEVEVDPDLFGHALENVLSNAFRHASTTVRVYGDNSTIRVWNDGQMPPEDDVAHLFDRYRTSSGGSTGIGLALTQEIATLHGWSVKANLLDDGLCVSFTCP